MMKLQRAFILFLLLICAIGANAQIVNTIRGIFQTASDTTVVVPDTALVQEVAVNEDSLLVLELQQQLDEAKLSEANLRMEFEQFKLNIIVNDSLKRHRQRMYIDSLRRITKGSPVMVDGDTLFYLYTKKGGETAFQRAQEAGELMEVIGKKINLDPGRVYIENTDIFTSHIFPATDILGISLSHIESLRAV